MDMVTRLASSDTESSQQMTVGILTVMCFFFVYVFVISV